MSNQSPICILADNDQVSLGTLEKIIQKLYPNLEIERAHDGRRATEIIEKNKKSPLIVISELKLPGLNGKELMMNLKAHKVAPVYLIATSAYTSSKTNLELIQNGIDDILPKPFQPDQIVSKIRTAMKIVVLAQQLESMPDEEDIKNMAKREMSLNISKLLNSFIAKKGLELPREILNRWQDITKHIFKLMQGDKFELAATLNSFRFVNTYKLYIEDAKINLPVMKNGFPSHGVMEEYPNYIREIFSYLKGLEQERDILMHVYENLDGTGIPDKKRFWHIPLGSRILRVLVEYQEAIKENIDDQHKAIEQIFTNVKRLYDHQIVVYLDQYLATNLPMPGEPEEKITKNKLREGYVLSRNIVTKDGLMLMPRKTKLEKDIIKTIWAKIEKEGMIGDIFIYTESKPEQGEKGDGKPASVIMEE